MPFICFAFLEPFAAKNSRFPSASILRNLRSKFPSPVCVRSPRLNPLPICGDQLPFVFLAPWRPVQRLCVEIILCPARKVCLYITPVPDLCALCTLCGQIIPSPIRRQEYL